MYESIWGARWASQRSVSRRVRRIRQSIERQLKNVGLRYQGSEADMFEKLRAGPSVGDEKSKDEPRNGSCDQRGAVSSETSPRKPGPRFYESHEQHSGKLRMFKPSGRRSWFNDVVFYSVASSSLICLGVETS